MGSTNRHRLMRVGLALAATATLASCKAGVTDPPTMVADTSAVLEGKAYSRDAGTVTHWFEYGPTEALGEQTPTRVFTVGPDVHLMVDGEVVTGLTEGTTYHYRSCAADIGGRGLCGQTRTLTTTSGRDSVTGQGYGPGIPSIGHGLGARVELSAEPDGSDAVGNISVTPGSFYFRLEDRGPVTCMRVEGNQATIGFIAVPPPEIPEGETPVPRLAFFEDNGPSGDRFTVRDLTEPATTCPDPAAVGGSAPTLVDGDFVVHDHTGG